MLSDYIFRFVCVFGCLSNLDDVPFIWLNKNSSINLLKVTDLEDMAVKMEYYLEEYNVVSSSPMSLVMFRYALDHISRCTRVLLQDNGAYAK